MGGSPLCLTKRGSGALHPWRGWIARDTPSGAHAAGAKPRIGCIYRPRIAGNTPVSGAKPRDGCIYHPVDPHRGAGPTIRHPPPPDAAAAEPAHPARFRSTAKAPQRVRTTGHGPPASPPQTGAKPRNRTGAHSGIGGRGDRAQASRGMRRPLNAAICRRHPVRLRDQALKRPAAHSGGHVVTALRSRVRLTSPLGRDARYPFGGDRRSRHWEIVRSAGTRRLRGPGRGSRSLEGRDTGTTRSKPTHDRLTRRPPAGAGRPAAPAPPAAVGCAGPAVCRSRSRSR